MHYSEDATTAETVQKADFRPGGGGNGRPLKERGKEAGAPDKAKFAKQ
jgi:hypothetical protein